MAGLRLHPEWRSQRRVPRQPCSLTATASAGACPAIVLDPGRFGEGKASGRRHRPGIRDPGLQQSDEHECQQHDEGTHLHGTALVGAERPRRLGPTEDGPCTDPISTAKEPAWNNARAATTNIVRRVARRAQYSRPTARTMDTVTFTGKPRRTTFDPGGEAGTPRYPPSHSRRCTKPPATVKVAAPTRRGADKARRARRDVRNRRRGLRCDRSLWMSWLYHGSDSHRYGLSTVNEPSS